MKKVEMLKAVVAKLGEAEVKMTQKDVDAVLAAYAEVVKETLAADKEEKVGLPNVGNFTVKHVGAKEGVIQMGDRKGEKWFSPEKDEIKFSVTKSVRII